MTKKTHEILIRFDVFAATDGAVAGVHIETLEVNGGSTSDRMVAPASFATLASELSDTDLSALKAAIDSEHASRGLP